MFLNHSKAFGDVLEASVAGLVPSGLLPQTRVETTGGWLPAARLEVGMSLYTYDGGEKPIVALRTLDAPGDAVRLPAGMLGCDDETHLAPGQMVMVETGAAMSWLNVPVALARAEDLIGHAGIRRRRSPATTLIQPLFEEEEILFAATGLRLYAAARDTHFDPQFYPVLTRDELLEVLK